MPNRQAALRNLILNLKAAYNLFSFLSRWKLRFLLITHSKMEIKDKIPVSVFGDK